MKSLKIAFSILLCVTILSVGASVVCAVIAGNTADSFRDYRSSVITTLSSLHAQLNSSKQAFSDALTYLDGVQVMQPAPETEALPESDTATDTTGTQSETLPKPEAAPETTLPTAMFTVREVGGRIGVFDASGVLVRTLNVSVATLPRADREQLSVGITLGSEQELQALIEDFSG